MRYGGIIGGGEDQQGLVQDQEEVRGRGDMEGETQEKDNVSGESKKGGKVFWFFFLTGELWAAIFSLTIPYIYTGSFVVEWGK